jgi:hypothetical protein
MEVAVEGMQDERHEIFVCFGVGLIFLLISVRTLLSFSILFFFFFSLLVAHVAPLPAPLRHPLRLCVDATF